MAALTERHHPYHRIFNPQHAAVGQRLELSCPASIFKGLLHVPLGINAKHPNPEQCSPTSGDGEFTFILLSNIKPNAVVLMFEFVF